jgi:pimeloyl-ACP methyl ester carboxylesterase
MDSVQSLAQRIADDGYRVVIHDRRNCGASDVVIAGEDSEYEIWADDLYELLGQLGARPAIVGGSSSGCRLSLLFALRHPEAVKGLLLWRVTGGGFAAERLAEKYYGLYIRTAREGGMEAVCRTEEFAERISDRPENRDRLMAMEPDQFIATMSHWLAYFEAGANLPVIGVTESELRSIAVPTCIVPGNDNTHPPAVAETAHRLIEGSELHTLMDEFLDVDTTPFEDWDEKEADLAGIFLKFLKKH